MNDEKNIRIDYRRYISTREGPNPSLSYHDYGIFPLSSIDVQFKRFLNGQINELEISKSDLDTLKGYFDDGKRKPLENLLAASFILYNAGADIDKENINRAFENRPKFVGRYKKKLNSSKKLYEMIAAEPRINSNVVNYDFLK